MLHGLNVSKHVFFIKITFYVFQMPVFLTLLNTRIW